MKQVLNYCTSNPNAIICYSTRGMLLQLHIDISYLYKQQVQRRAGGYVYLGGGSANRNNPPLPSKTVPLHNDETHMLSNIMRNALSSDVEAKTGSIFEHFQKSVPIHLTFGQLSHTQPESLVQTDGSYTAGIANDTVKTILIQNHWHEFLLVNIFRQNQFIFYWCSVRTNLADYFTNHHPPSHHKIIITKYLSAFRAISLRLCSL